LPLNLNQKKPSSNYQSPGPPPVIFKTRRRGKGKNQKQQELSLFFFPLRIFPRKSDIPQPKSPRHQHSWSPNPNYASDYDDANPWPLIINFQNYFLNLSYKWNQTASSLQTHPHQNQNQPNRRKKNSSNGKITSTKLQDYGVSLLLSTNLNKRSKILNRNFAPLFK